MTDATIVKSSPEPMRVGEAIAFTIDFADQVNQNAPTSPTVTAYDATGADKSTQTLSGSASVSGNVVTLQKFTPESAQVYRLVCEVTIDNNTVFGIVDIDVLVVSPAVTITNGYLTMPQATREIAPYAKTDSPDDGVIGALIEETSRFIDAEIGRTFYARTETRYYSIPEGRLLRLDDDLLTITTLTNGDAATIAATEYNFVPKNTAPYYGIRLKEMSSYYWTYDSDGNTEDVISIAGTWGYASTAPADIERCCKLIVGNWYRQRFGDNQAGVTTITAAGIVITPQDVPGAAWRILNSYRKRY